MTNPTRKQIVATARGHLARMSAQEMRDMLATLRQMVPGFASEIGKAHGFACMGMIRAALKAASDTGH